MIQVEVTRPAVFVPGAPFLATLRGDCACGREVALSVMTELPRLLVRVRCPDCGAVWIDGHEAAAAWHASLLPGGAPDNGHQ